MKWIVALILVSQIAWAENSRVIPTFLEASQIYSSPDFTPGQNLYLRPELQAVLKVLEDHRIDPALLEKYTYRKSAHWALPKDDKFDHWIKHPQADKSHVVAPELALHAIKLDVIEESDDFFNDDIYVYYFITDGVIPTGKVTSIYKGLNHGQSFFFNEVDRAIFPLAGVLAKSPQNHLVVDYGIVESDGDDIKDLQKLSSVIIDIAIVVYSSYDPENGEVVAKLRKEIKALADMLLALNNDDRLVASSLGWKADELSKLLSEQTYVEVKKNHKKHTSMESFEYDITFRLLRN